jgi:hypothetical protein
VACIRALRSGTVRTQRLEAALLAMHLTVFVVTPFLVVNPGQALAFIGVHQAVFGFCMGSPACRGPTCVGLNLW